MTIIDNFKIKRMISHGVNSKRDLNGMSNFHNVITIKKRGKQKFFRSKLTVVA